MTANFLKCPRCGSTRFYSTDSEGKMVFFQLDQNLQASVTTNGESRFKPLNLLEIFCTGCSWSGTPRQLMPQTP